MTQKRRILLNIMATYGRSLYSMACGIFVSRWVLIALGVENYGLYGVVAGLATFISFFNGVLAGSISRFYAFSIGKDLADKLSNNECCAWFNTAVFIHTIIPLVLISLGYPLGSMAIEHWLTIPAEKIEDCRIVWKCVCVSCFIGMVNVPFSAMYTAKQYIAELTLYSVIVTTCNVLILYYMVWHPRDWLVDYATYMCLAAVVPQVIICIRAMVVFPECKFHIALMFSKERLRSLGSYSFWQMFGGLGSLVRCQGMALLVNKCFGPTFNATMALSNAVSAQTEALAAAMQGAFTPAVTTMAGAGDRSGMLAYCYRASKFGTLLCLLFVLPLSVELQDILKMWLKEPPPLLTAACRWTLVYMVLGQVLRGIDLSLMAVGRISRLMLYVGGYMVLSLPVAWAAIHFFSFGFLSVPVVLVAFRLFVGVITVPIARKEVGYSAKYCLFKIVFPICCAAALALFAGITIQHIFQELYFIRIGISSVTTVCVLILASWLFVLDQTERSFLYENIRRHLSML